MRVVFWSSTEFSGYMPGLIRELNARGISARARWLVSEKKYRRASSRLDRCWLRVQQYLLYPLKLVFSLVTERSVEVQVICTNTFYAPLLGSLFHGRVVFLLYDLFPEAMVQSGKVEENSLASLCLRRLTRHTLKRCSATVFLGERLRHYVEGQYGAVPRAYVIPVGGDGTAFQSSGSPGKQEVNAPIPVGLMYCGNLGNLHDLETVVHYWREYAEQQPGPGSINWRWVCSGPKLPHLKRAVAGLPTSAQDHISIEPSLPAEDWAEAMISTDLALVTMIKGAERVVMPSKTYSAMLAGQAILAIAPLDSDLADLIKESGAGWCVEPGDVQGLKRILDVVASDHIQLNLAKQRSREYSENHFSMRELSKSWQILFEKERRG